uniref:Nitric oxide synthase-interacting protein homolog n=1 Tax=Glossina austeni TaxID=7395 RepID=A0A1A9V5R3_GLOAU
MTRHARNCTAGAVYTYNEKKKDANESGYGTNAQRLGKDSVKPFDCCCLTLQPCRNPVISRDGYLFDKEAILKYIITKKNEYSRKLKEYEKLKKAFENKQTQEIERQQRIDMEKFVKAGKPVNGAVQKHLGARATTTIDVDSISNMANGNEKKLPSFWLPSESPNAGNMQLEKPDSTIFCPVSGKPLKVKDLINVKFTLLKDGDASTSLIAKEVRYMCPVTHDVLSNAVPCAVLRTTGDVVTMECVEKLIKKDMIHPLNNEKLKDKDIIPLQRGGTGYALTNAGLEAKEKRPMLQA